MTTYQDYLNDGGTALYQTRDVGRADGRLHHRCDCGQYAAAGTLVDMRAFDLGGDFACDGCLSHWARTKTPIMPGDVPFNEADWQARFSEHRTGLPDIAAQRAAQAALEREIKILDQYEAAYTADPTNPEKARLRQKRLNLITHRRTI